MIDLALQSTAPWCWLAGIFAAPLDAEAIAASRVVANEFAAISPMPSLVPGLRQMHEALDALPAGQEGVAALSRSYTLLFSGAAGDGGPGRGGQTAGVPVAGAAQSGGVNCLVLCRLVSEKPCSFAPVLLR